MKIEKAKKPKKETKTAKNQQKHCYQKIIINDIRIHPFGRKWAEQSFNLCFC